MTSFLTRRGFLAAGAALPLGWRALAEAAPPPRWVYLGTDKGAGISRCTWDPTTGTLGEPELATRTVRPAFLALHPRLPRLYAVNSAAASDAAVSCFDLDRRTGALRLLNKQPSRGDGPCFVSVDATGRSAFVANYSGGSLAGLQLTVDGLLLPPTGTLQCRNAPACGHPGPVHDRQDAAHLHSATLTPGNDFLLTCDLGNDAIEVVAIRPGADNPLGPSFRVAARPGSGPRHVVFHPNGRWAFVVHELDCTVERFDWSVIAGRASLLRQEGSAVSTVTPGALTAKTSPEGNTACEILMARGGQFVYVCTRGEDTITSYRVEHEGSLRLQQRIACGGKTPRHMAFDPSQQFLLCANQATPGSVTVFAHHPETGELRGPLQTLAADTPMFVQFT